MSFHWSFPVFFGSSNLSGGNVAAGYGFNVTQTGFGTKVVNIGSSGAAFGVAKNTNLTIMSLLLATNDRTGARANGYRNVYDTNGDGVLDDNEKALRVLANVIYSAINEGGHISRRCGSTDRAFGLRASVTMSKFRKSLRQNSTFAARLFEFPPM